jgi:hypothetical protein
MSVVAATAPVITASAASRTRRTPNRFMTAANGPSVEQRDVDCHRERDRGAIPSNSVSSGTIRTPGVARTPGADEQDHERDRCDDPAVMPGEIQAH